MTTVTTPTTTPRSIAPARGAVPLGLALVGAVLATNGLLLGSRLLMDPQDYSEIGGTWLHLAHYTLWTVCLVVLSQLYPRLDVLRGRTGASLPRLVLGLAGAGAALDACARFVSAFVVPYLTDRAPVLVDSTPDTILLVPLVATGVVALTGTTVLGVSGWRRQVFPRPAVVLLVLGGVTIPVLGPVSNVLLGSALVWIGVSARRGR